MPEISREVVYRTTAVFEDEERQEFRLNKATTLVLSRAVLETWGADKWRFYAYGYRKEHWNHEREAREYSYSSRWGGLPEPLHPLFLEMRDGKRDK